jgi:hypothetical protein
VKERRESSRRSQSPEWGQRVPQLPAVKEARLYWSVGRDTVTASTQLQSGPAMANRMANKRWRQSKSGLGQVVLE